MADIKPLGSEKLNNDEKLKRILELTYYNSNNKTNNKSKPELVKESKVGGIYGIVKEKDGYYVKRGLNESSLDYIGGLFMKNKNKFSSYAEALKRLELLKGQEEIQEATKYVLKQKSKQNEVETPPPPPMDSEPSGESMPPPPPSDMGNEPSPEMGSEPSPEGMDTPDMGGDESSQKRSDYMAEIQKFAGKLGQELRDQKERLESDDIKYVLNMIISAVDLDKLEFEDLEEIGKKFERDEESGMGDETPEPDMGDETTEPEMDTEKSQEMSEYDKGMKALEDFESWDISELGEEDTDEIVELDLDEIKSTVNKSVSDILNKYFDKI